MVWIVTMLVALSSAAAAHAQSSTCRMGEAKKYYGQELDKKFKARSEANAIAQALYRGPLLREGEAAGVGSLQGLFAGRREIDVRQIQEIAKGHLYGTSEEFRNTLQKLVEKHGAKEANARVRDSIYSAFGYRAKSGPSEEELDACLIGDRQAHVVLTKVIVSYLDRKKLG